MTRLLEFKKSGGGRAEYWEGAVYLGRCGDWYRFRLPLGEGREVSALLRGSLVDPRGPYAIQPATIAFEDKRESPAVGIGQWSADTRELRENTLDRQGDTKRALAATADEVLGDGTVA